MRRIILALLVGLISFSSFGVSNKKELKAEAEKYFSYITKKNIDGILNSMYPEVFKAVSRKDLKSGMEQMFNNPEMEVEVLKTKINSFSETVTNEKVDYVLLNYTSEMKMTFLSEINKTEEEKESFLNYMKSIMIAQFGEDNVKVNYETISIDVTSITDMYAIFDIKYNKWKFIGNDNAMKSIINIIIPVEVRNQLLVQN